MDGMRRKDQLGREGVADLLRQAEDFAATAVEGVLCRLEEDPRRPNRLYHHYARLVLGLEVHFLFPNLTLAERNLLVRLLEARNAIQVRQTAGCRAVAARAGKGTRSKRMVSPWERRLRLLRGRARGLSRASRLTPAQREVMRAVFLAKEA
jgi:hypothetical protein